MGLLPGFYIEGYHDGLPDHRPGGFHQQIATCVNPMR